MGNENFLLPVGLGGTLDLCAQPDSRLCFDCFGGWPMSAEASLGTTYEIVQPPPLNPDAVLSRLSRWQMQAVSRKLLATERVARCLRRRRANTYYVEVRRSKTGTAHYGGLEVCGSIWSCPICAVKITTRRAAEVSQGFGAWQETGGVVYMLTLTVPHYHHQSLKTVLEGFSKARRLLRNRKVWKRVVGQKTVGSIRALEVTFGSNGWHVHSHELIFAKQEIGLEDLRSVILEAWQRAVMDAGLGCPNAHGLDIERVYSAEEYIAKFGHDRKWGADKELTKSHIKKGRWENMTPWDMLRAIASGDERQKERFVEYALQMKGTRQLVWSKGLRKLLGLEDQVTDQELAEAQEDGSEILGLLSFEEWQVVLSREVRGELLEKANVGGWPAVVGFIKDLFRMEGRVYAPRLKMVGSFSWREFWGQLYGELEPLTQYVMAELIDQGMCEADLLKLDAEGFHYCRARNSFVQVQGTKTMMEVV